MSAAPQVVTLGLHILDVLGRPISRIPPGQEVDLVDEITMTVAGTAAATAVDLARLGVRVASSGVVGDDTMGAFVRERMAAEGVDVSGLAVTEKAQTAATILAIRPDGSRPPWHVVGASAELTADRIDWPVLESARVLHFGGSGLLPGLDGRPAAELLARARAAGLVTVMDFIPTKDPAYPDQLAACLPHVDHVLPSLEDALLVAGTSDRAEAITWFHDRGVGTTVITLGGDGVSIAPRGGPEKVLPAFAVDVVDTTGCGDAFSAGFIAGLLEGREPLAAAELGLAAGSLVATGLGSDAGITDRAALDRFAAATPRGPGRTG